MLEKADQAAIAIAYLSILLMLILTPFGCLHFDALRLERLAAKQIEHCEATARELGRACKNDGGSACGERAGDAFDACIAEVLTGAELLKAKAENALR